MRRPRLRRDRGGWTEQDVRLRRHLRLVVGVFTALLWVDNLSEHYRGGFYKKLMWAPIVAGPVAATASIASGLSERPFWRRAFLGLSAVQAVIAAVGFAAHHGGIVARVGSGRRMYLFNAWYGPPLFAPLQYLGFAVLGLLAALPRRALAPVLRVTTLPRLLRAFTAVNVPPLWAEIAYFHARGSYQDPFQWTPVVGLPVVGAISTAAAVSESDRVSRAYRGGALFTVGLGLVGTAFHLVGLGRRYGGFGRKALLFNWLSGPPVPAPLQLIALGLVGLAGERARRRR